MVCHVPFDFRKTVGHVALLAIDASFMGAMIALLMSAMATPALAYVDPSVMTYTIQALTAVAVALSAVLGVAFRRTRRAIMRLFNIDEHANQVVEPRVHRIKPSQKEFADWKAEREMSAAAGGQKAAGAKGEERLPWHRRLVVALIVCSFTVYTVFVVAPLELDAENSSSLVFGPGVVWGPIVLAGVVLAAALTLVVSAFRGKYFDFVVSLVMAFGVSCYVQALFMNGNLGAADGDSVDWTQFLPDVISGLLVWIVILAAAVLFSRRKPRQTRGAFIALSAALIVVQTVGLASLAVNVDENQMPQTYRTQEGLYDVSDKSNVIVIVLDMTDNNVMQNVYRRDPYMLDEFTGFTWYQNTTGSMIPTRYGIPSLLTGVTPQEGDDFVDFRANWYQNSHFLDDVAAQGYSIGIYSDSEMWDKNSAEAIESHAINVKYSMDPSADVVDERGTVLGLYKCALYRDLPWLAKPFFWFTTEEISNDMLETGGEYDPSKTLYRMNDPAFYQNLKDYRLRINNDQTGSFRFIHLMGTHFPYKLDAEGNYWETGTDETAQMRGAFHITSEYLHQLKELGVYDNSTIIVTADHGTWYPTDRPIDIPTAPIILVKPAQSAELDAQPCQISEKPVSHLDLQATMLDGMGADQSVLDHYGEYNVPIQDRNDPDDRPRFYDMLIMEGNRTDVSVLQYQIVGDERDFKNWQLDGLEWPIRKE